MTYVLSKVQQIIAKSEQNNKSHLLTGQPNPVYIHIFKLNDEV